MASLILVVISIALLASVAAVSMNYVPMEAYQRQQLHNEAEAGLQAMTNGVSRYLNSNRDGQGDIIYPGNGVNMVPLFSPTYGFVPAEVRKEMTWEATTAAFAGLPAVGICLRPISTSNLLQQEALQHLKESLPLDSAYVASACGASANVVGGTHLTYWLPLSHIN